MPTSPPAHQLLGDVQLQDAAARVLQLLGHVEWRALEVRRQRLLP